MGQFAVCVLGVINIFVINMYFLKFPQQKVQELNTYIYHCTSSKPDVSHYKERTLKQLFYVLRHKT